MRGTVVPIYTRRNRSARAIASTAVDIRQLELFLAVIESGSVTRAAERVHLSPGAVSLQLHNLASELGTELFVRCGKRFTPTPAALRLSELASRLMRQVREIEHEFAKDASVDHRPFHLATGATTLIHRLGRPLRLLRKQYPQTSIRVTVCPTEEMVAGLLERKFDLALISLPYDETSLTIMPLYEEELLIMRPSAKPVRAGAVGYIEPQELATAKFLLYPKRSNMRSIIDAFFRDLKIAPQVIMEADDTEVIKKLVETGFGFSILPESALRVQPRFYHLFRVRDHKMARRQALAMIKSDYPRALTVSIARFLQAKLAEDHHGHAAQPVSRAG